MGISVGGENLKDSVVDGEESDIESTASKIEDEDVGLPAGLVHSVCDGSGGGFVDDTLHLETGDGTGILGGLTLGVVEVSGDGDDGILDLLAQEGLGGGLHLLEDHGGDFLRREFLLLAVDENFDHGLVVVADNGVGDELFVGLDGLIGKVASDETFDVEDGVFGVDSGLVLGGITYETLAVLHEGDIGRGDTVTLVVGHDFDAAIFEDTHTRVGCSQIDSDGGADFVLFVGEDG